MKLSFNHTITPPGFNWSLKPFSIQIEMGSITLLEGDNGSGKSNFLKIIAGVLLPHYSIQSFHDLTPNIINISGLYQPIPFDPQLTLKQNIGLWGNSPHTSEPDDTIKQYLTRLNLDQYQNTLWGSMSSGTQQKLGIAKALSQKADLYFLDEPFAHVDEKSINSILNIVEEKLENNATIIVTTHIKHKSIFNFKFNYKVGKGKIYSN